MDLSPLDNSIWNALSSGHSTMAVRHGLAARYASDASPLAGLDSPSAAAFEDLRHLALSDDAVALMLEGPVAPPSGWTVHVSTPLDQMICPEPAQQRVAGPLLLTAEDAGEMLALAQATEPGPFRPGTHRMGRYLGIRAEDGRLVAMAGERQRLDGFTEVSAVCTLPEFRGRGYGQTLVAAVTALIAEEGRIPFLHVRPENAAARRLYERLGYVIRRQVHLLVLSPVDAARTG
jgi:predicted GNAT family acetyltransferase